MVGVERFSQRRAEKTLQDSEHPQEARRVGRLCKMTHTRLLGRVVVIAIMASGVLGNLGKPCSKGYQPLYEEEEVSSLLRVHTNLNPNCVNLLQLISCQENKKAYWMAWNTASFRQRLLGGCSVGEAWLCFEQDTTQACLVDLIKEKKVVKTRTK